MPFLRTSNLIERRNRAPRWPFVLNKDSPLSVGLKGWWPGVGSGSRLIEMSGQAGDAIQTIGSDKPTLVGTRFGSTALSFDGINDRVEYAGFSWPSGGPITIAFWNHVLTADVQGSSAFGVGPASTTNRLQCHCPWSDKNLYWDYGDIASGGRVSTDYTSFLDKWTHVVLVASGASGLKQEVWLDSIGQVGSPNNSEPASLTGLSIGNWDVVYHKGKIFNFAIWNRVISRSEIRQLYYPATRWDLAYELGRTVYFFPAAGGGTVIVGLANELNTAFAITRSKQSQLALAQETDIGLGVSAQHSLQLGLASESGIAFAVSPQRKFAVAQALEVDTAFGVSRQKNRSVGLASETDVALRLLGFGTISVGLALETDIGLAVAAQKAKGLGLVVEADAAQNVTVKFLWRGEAASAASWTKQTGLAGSWTTESAVGTTWTKEDEL